MEKYLSDRAMPQRFPLDMVEHLAGKSLFLVNGDFVDAFDLHLQPDHGGGAGKPAEYARVEGVITIVPPQGGRVGRITRYLTMEGLEAMRPGKPEDDVTAD